MFVSQTDRQDTGPLSHDTKEIVKLTSDVSEDLLDASRVVSSGVFTVFKSLGKSAVVGAEIVSSVVYGEGEGEVEVTTNPNMATAVEIGTAGVESMVDICKHTSSPRSSCFGF